MGNIIFDFAPEEFLGDTSPRTNQLYVPDGSGASSTSPGTRTSMLHTIDDAELLHQNLSTSGGQFSVLNSYTDIDENGFLMDLSPVFSLYVHETNLAIVLGYLSSKEMAILNGLFIFASNPSLKAARPPSANVIDGAPLSFLE
mgnify:CR=1 FL=1